MSASASASASPRAPCQTYTYAISPPVFVGDGMSNTFDGRSAKVRYAQCTIALWSARLGLQRRVRAKRRIFQQRDGEVVDRSLSLYEARRGR